MKTHHLGCIVGGVLVLGYGYYFYAKKHTAGSKTGALNGQPTGYSNMTNLTPRTYTPTSFQANENISDFDDAADYMPVTWALGQNGGNATDINGGWTNWGDEYSASVSSSWLQSEAQGAHL